MLISSKMVFNILFQIIYHIKPKHTFLVKIWWRLVIFLTICTKIVWILFLWKIISLDNVPFIWICLFILQRRIIYFIKVKSLSMFSITLIIRKWIALLVKFKHFFISVNINSQILKPFFIIFDTWVKLVHLSHKFFSLFFVNNTIIFLNLF